MSSPRKTKKNISSNPSQAPKITKNKVRERKAQQASSSNSNSNSGKKTINLGSANQNDFIESLLSQGKKSNSNIISSAPPSSSSELSKGRQSIRNRLENVKHKQNKSKKDKMIYNFHHAINKTNSDQIIVKMLELNETDIINFYGNLEKMIGKDLSCQIRQEMTKDIKDNQKISGGQMAICPFCQENKSNCVILLCGHLICHKCGKNINRCKYPCPKCQKPIKYIQYIVD